VVQMEHKMKSIMPANETQKGCGDMFLEGGCCDLWFINGPALNIKIRTFKLAHTPEPRGWLQHELDPFYFYFVLFLPHNWIRTYPPELTA